MSIEFLGKEISGRYTILSGIVMTSVSVLEKFGQEASEFGILTTKSISKNPRDGNKEPILAQTSPGNWINAVGLANPGAEKFAEQLLNINIPKKRFLLASIIGSNEKDFREVAETLCGQVDGFELNVSCPHAKGEGQTIGQDYELVTKIIRNVKTLGKPIVVKLSPKANIEESVKAILKGGADGFVAINTYGPEKFLVNNDSVLSNGVGGLSGKQILEKGIGVVGEIRKRTSLPIIGGGGISIAKDILRYRDNGANYFGLGSAAFPGMSTEEIKTFAKVINKDVENGTNHAESLLKTELNMDYKKIRVVENKRLADDLFVLRFDNSTKVKAGQFVMLWSPEKGQKPFSVYNDKPFEVLVQKKGCFTKYLSELESGNELYVQGPHGNPPDVKGKLLLVGGGTGVAALRMFTKEYKSTMAVIGVKDRAHLPDTRDWKTNEIIIYSNDGSVGTKGNVTDNLEQIITTYQPDYILACGPKGMLDDVKRRGSKLRLKENILISEELITMCGMGICGRCATKDGLRNCRDGTFI